MGKWTNLSNTGNSVGGETPAGTLNGSNVTFTLAYAPNPVGSLELELNGILQKRGTDYTLSGVTITFTEAPFADDWMLAFYDR